MTLALTVIIDMESIISFFIVLAVGLGPIVFFVGIGYIALLSLYSIVSRLVSLFLPKENATITEPLLDYDEDYDDEDYDDED